MRGSLRAMAGLTALMAPISAGWAYTAGVSVGEGGSGLAGLFSEETVDEFITDGWVITRESSDGVVTMSARGPDGASVAIDDLPAAIADRLAYYENDWSPPEESVFETVDGVTCYTIGTDLAASGDYRVVEETNGLIRIIEAEVDRDGGLMIEAKQFPPGTLTDEQLEAVHAAALPVADMAGGTDIEACG